MKREPFRKQAYVSPAIKVVPTAFDQQLLSTSFPNNGGHKKVGDDDDLNAKQGFFDDEEEEEENTPQYWGIDNSLY